MDYKILTVEEETIVTTADILKKRNLVLIFYGKIHIYPKIKLIKSETRPSIRGGSELDSVVQFVHCQLPALAHF